MSENPPPAEPAVAGVSPWLPWPFSAWAWANEPVRAERLAALRIGIALCLLADILINYAPGLVDFFLKDGLGHPSSFDWRFEAPRSTWSLFRGFGDLTNLHLALGVWLLASGWILFTSFARFALMDRNPPAEDRTGVALILAACGHAWYSAGVWARIVTAQKADELAWIVPLLGLSLVCLFCALELACRLRDPEHRIPWFKLGFSFAAALIALILGGLVRLRAPYEATETWFSLLGPWQESDRMMTIAMALWIAFTILLLVGCWTKLAAVAVWMLSMSFANLNTNLDNAGDTIRMIVLFYLMFCPAGAAWSVDAFFRRKPGPKFVHPWAIRLLFFQMMFIYGMNGYYKMFGGSWVEGSSLHYVLGDLAIARFSRMLIPVPFFITQIMSWTVLGWEICFPVLVLWKWTRRPALVFGVMFHLGIFATMELAGFALYAICLYLPLIPWEAYCRDKRGWPDATAPAPDPPPDLT